LTEAYSRRNTKKQNATKLLKKETVQPKTKASFTQSNKKVRSFEEQHSQLCAMFLFVGDSNY